MGQRGRLIVGVLAVALVLFLGLRLLSGGDDEVLPSRAALVGVGDCVEVPHDDDELLQLAACGAPHEAQVFAEFELDDGEYPGDAAVDEKAERGCVERWDRAVGTNYFTDLTFDFVTVTPGPERWADGVREVSCLLVTADRTPMVGSQLLG